MSDFTPDAEVLISHLSSRPVNFATMIRIDKPPKSSHLMLPARASSLGNLDRLPPELMIIILNMLDMESLELFQKISHLGHLFIQSLQEYQELVTSAPEVLAALVKVHSIGLHPVNKLSGLLRQEQCTTCSNYGALLFIPTCDRSRWDFLLSKPSRMVVSPREAQKYFGLSKKQVRGLDTLYAIPGTYSRCILREPTPLVSVIAAKALGLLTHGSAEALADAMVKRSRSTNGIRVGAFLESEFEPNHEDSVLRRGTGIIQSLEHDHSHFGFRPFSFVLPVRES